MSFAICEAEICMRPGMARQKKRGPKRKPGPRYSCGKRKKLKKNPHGDGNSPFDQEIRNWAFWKQHVIKLASDRRFGSVLGQLELSGVLTPVQAAAGQRYAEIVDRYERLMGFSRRHATSTGFLREFSSYDPNRQDDEELHDLVRSAREDYKKVQLLIPPYPSAARRIIDEVCCNDRGVEPSDYAGLVLVLDKLGKCFGLNRLNIRTSAAHHHAG
jgi:hypothetical protein